MLRTIKLVIYYFLYQFLFTAIILVPTLLIQFVNSGGDLAVLSNPANTGTYTAISLLLSGVAMVWHLIHFKYVRFNLKSFSEVSGKTIGLSIPFILASMVFFNLCSEFLELPDYMQDTLFSMSRDVFGIISIAIMAPIVEELLFRGAIQGYLLRRGMKPIYAILIASAVFGIVHFNPAQVVFAFAIGMIFGWLYYRTGSVVPGIVGHFINNGIATILAAAMSKEDYSTKIIDHIGVTSTYLLFAGVLVIMVGMFFYLKKSLPKAPPYKEEFLSDTVD